MTKEKDNIESKSMVIKSPLISSKLLYNGSTSPIVLKKDRKGKIVLHPRKTIRVNSKDAEIYLKKFPVLEEKK